MKILYALAAALFMASIAWGQSPEKMSYQAIIRDASNALVSTQTVGMQISILQGGTNGTAVYVETHTPTTNTNGLVSLEIGTGTLVSGDFTTIEWSTNSHFIKTETDTEGGTNYTIAGITQLMSVPYALYAKTSGSSIPGPAGAAGTNGTNGTNGANGSSAYELALKGGYVGTEAEWLTSLKGVGGVTKPGKNVTITGSGTVANPYVVNVTSVNSGHYVGELFGGGIVFYVYDNGAHGLIASLHDLDGGSGTAYSGITNVEIGTKASSMIDGASNTAAILAQNATANKAATLCNSYSYGGFSDWYLPAIRELNLLCSQDLLIDRNLDNDGNAATNGFSRTYESPTFGAYRSSTESGSTSSWVYRFGEGHSYRMGKISSYRVRAVRAF